MAEERGHRWVIGIVLTLATIFTPIIYDLLKGQPRTQPAAATAEPVAVARPDEPAKSAATPAPVPLPPPNLPPPEKPAAPVVTEESRSPAKLQSFRISKADRGRYFPGTKRCRPEWQQKGDWYLVCTCPGNEDIPSLRIDRPTSEDAWRDVTNLLAREGWTCP